MAVILNYEFTAKEVTLELSEIYSMRRTVMKITKRSNIAY